MKLPYLLRRLAAQKLWRPYSLGLMARDLLGTSRWVADDNLTHVTAAIDWLCRAQDKTGTGGVSAGWSFEDGWLPPYPETSGYTVETFIAASEALERSALLGRAERILDWLLALQHLDGAFPGHFGEEGSQPVIFNTGQIMHGMAEGYIRLGREDCLEAAVKAGRWMAERLDRDGAWRRSVHNNVVHAYNTRAAWALMRVAKASGETRLGRAARRNMNWALTRQDETGWFLDNAFQEGGAVFTHNLAYVIRGLLEGGLLSGEERYLAAAEKTARRAAALQRKDGSLAGSFSQGWAGDQSYVCLTGVAQMSIIWNRMATALGDDSLKENARRANHYLKKNHARTGRGDPGDGALPGSAPIWGAYSRFEFPNWGVKFFVDALLTEETGRVIPAPNGKP